MKSVLGILIAAAVTSVPGLAPGAEPERFVLRFEDLPGLIRSENHHVKSARLEAEAARERTGYLTRSLLPQVALEAGGESFQTGTFQWETQPFAGIEARLNLFRGGRDLLESRARDAESSAAEFEAIDRDLEEVTKARLAYWRLVHQREVLELLRSARAQNQKNLEAALKRIRGGLATESDRLEFEIGAVELDQDISRMELQIASAQRELAALLGKGLDTQFVTATEVPHDHDDAILKQSLESKNHREIRALQATEEAREALSAQAARWWTPSVDAYAGYALHTMRESEFFAGQDRDETVFGVRLTLELFDGLQNKKEADALRRRADAARAETIQTSRELQARLENSRQEVILMHDLLHQSEKSVEKGVKYLDLTLSEYARGVKNSPDVLSATENFTDLKRRYAEVRRDYQIARSELMALLGN